MRLAGPVALEAHFTTEPAVVAVSSAGPQSLAHEPAVSVELHSPSPQTAVEPETVQSVPGSVPEWPGFQRMEPELSRMMMTSGRVTLAVMKRMGSSLAKLSLAGMTSAAAITIDATTEILA